MRKVLIHEGIFTTISGTDQHAASERIAASNRLQPQARSDCPRVRFTTYHVQAGHKPKHAEGPFLTSLLEATGCPDPDKGSNPSKRLKLIDRIKDACARNGSGVVAMFFDEAQRYGENEYEWLRDVHDHLDRISIRLFTFLIGQEELHAVKTAFQQARKTQIVARLMVEELPFHGLRDPADTATWSLAAHIEQAGLFTLAQLIDHINGIGRLWYGSIPGL